MRLRVIAGRLGGRLFDAPDTTLTHPMGDRIKGSLFNILGDVTGMTVLDPFAGSGALSFEAISRGAKSALLLDRDKRAQKTIQKNIESLGLGEQAKLVAASCRAWSENNPTKKFDLILADPPYNEQQLSTVDLLTQHLKPKGLMVLSYPGRDLVPTVNGVVVVDKRIYGDAALAFYQQRPSQ
jgi:16S rRNA (guanine966-N2)-methyltransferase